MNLLITGSRGFIGKNFIQKIQTENLDVFEFNRNESFDVLYNYLDKVDFIVHLAGEVRPNSTKEELENSNVSLTTKIINYLELNKKITPILYISSIHARLLKNEYGKTKRESELLVEQYSTRNKCQCFIYRLPHVFGEGCKANYNSVISTWIYNSINNLELNVFDRNIEIQYVYVQDIIEEFLSCIRTRKKSELYMSSNIVYNTTLGEVIDFINEFKLNIVNTQYEIRNNDFKKKLFNTYKDYYKVLSER
ncbi:NAD-dependent epimerase/dehydratase family protein [Arcobacter sp.]|uniref:NAD-dependent epimerase/dehydratase family protein n=1 Tax=Arcobacter sp. TaxID=1872629 RepID=UPI003C787861